MILKKRAKVRNGKQIDEGASGGVGIEIPFSQTPISFDSVGGRNVAMGLGGILEGRSNFLNWISFFFIEMD